MKKFLGRVLWTVVFLSPAIGLVIAHPWSTASAHPPPAKTVQLVVRPVTAQGEPADGYQVVVEEAPDGFRCTGSSPVAVTAGVATCGRPDDDTIACWKSSDHTVLCLRDPRSHRLSRIPYVGSFPATPVTATPEPMALDLHFYGSCSLRTGGSTTRLAAHPSWSATYACTSPKHGPGYLYGPGGSSVGLDRSVAWWRAQWTNLKKSSPKLDNDRVNTAYRVGTAA